MASVAHNYYYKTKCTFFAGCIWLDFLPNRIDSPPPMRVWGKNQDSLSFEWSRGKRWNDLGKNAQWLLSERFCSPSNLIHVVFIAAKALSDLAVVLTCNSKYWPRHTKSTDGSCKAAIKIAIWGRSFSEEGTGRRIFVSGNLDASRDNPLSSQSPITNPQSPKRLIKLLVLIWNSQ